MAETRLSVHVYNRQHQIVQFVKLCLEVLRSWLSARVLIDWLQSLTGFLQVMEDWKKSGNLSAQGKVRGKYFFLEKSGKMKNSC